MHVKLSSPFTFFSVVSSQEMRWDSLHSVYFNISWISTVFSIRNPNGKSEDVRTITLCIISSYKPQAARTATKMINYPFRLTLTKPSKERLKIAYTLKQSKECSFPMICNKDSIFFHIQVIKQNKISKLNRRHILWNGLFMNLKDMNDHAASRRELLVAGMALEVFRFLVLH